MGLIKTISLPMLGDERGGLIAIEAQKNISFDIKRAYYIFGTKNDVIRGLHAHINLSQVMVCINGSCTVTLDDGFKREKMVLGSPDQGLLIEDLIWREMTDFSPDCVCLVLASNYYDESDYIRDYSLFLNKVRKI